MRAIRLILAFFFLVVPARSGEELAPMRGQPYGRVADRQRNGVNGLGRAESREAAGQLPPSLEPKEFAKAKAHPDAGSHSPPRLVEARSDPLDGTLDFSPRAPSAFRDDFGIPGLVSPEALAIDKYALAESGGNGRMTAAPDILPPLASPSEIPLDALVASIPDPTPVVLPADLSIIKAAEAYAGTPEPSTPVSMASAFPGADDASEPKLPEFLFPTLEPPVAPSRAAADTSFGVFDGIPQPIPTPPELTAAPAVKAGPASSVEVPVLALPPPVPSKADAGGLTLPLPEETRRPTRESAPTLPAELLNAKPPTAVASARKIVSPAPPSGQKNVLPAERFIPPEEAPYTEPPLPPGIFLP